MKYVVWSLVLVLVCLHQDYWQWNKVEPMVLGFVPFNLAWQVGISLAAACVWVLAVSRCWPSGPEFDESPTSENGP